MVAVRMTETETPAHSEDIPLESAVLPFPLRALTPVKKGWITQQASSLTILEIRTYGFGVTDDLARKHNRHMEGKTTDLGNPKAFATRLRGGRIKGVFETCYADGQVRGLLTVGSVVVWMERGEVLEEVAAILEAKAKKLEVKTTRSVG